MIAWVPQPVAFNLGSLAVYWYGLIIALAVVVSYVVALKFAPRFKVERRQVEKLLGWAIVGGVIGSRLAEIIIFNPSYYLAHLSEIWQLRLGGSSILGVLAGVFIVIILFSRHHHLNWRNVVDLAAIAAPLGQAIGRWGNFFNQELYGLPTAKPWGIFIEQAHRLPSYEWASYFHPTFFYECLLSVVLFCLLLLYVKKTSFRPGQVLGLYLIGYGLIRFFLEFWRIDPAPWWAGLRAPQWLALLMIIIGVVYWLKKQRQIRRGVLELGTKDTEAL